MKFSLSKFYPSKTVYFHCFPVGQDSHYFNPMPVWVDALAPGRALTCAGNGVKIAVFGSATTPEMLSLLRDELGVPILPFEHIVSLPGDITLDVQGAERNEKIKSALADIVPDGEFIMSQPYLDGRLSSKYQFSPELSLRLNDKSRLADIIPEEYIARRHGSFKSGRDFFETKKPLTVPCVIKITSSGGGDGVRICKTDEDVRDAKDFFKDISGALMIEEYIEPDLNIGVQFGIPHNSEEPISIIGLNEQLTTHHGGYLGGMVDRAKPYPAFEQIKKILLEEILPRVRKLGWYGVGDIDVIVAPDGRLCFIDGNFRLTAATPYLMQACNGEMKKPMIHFTSSFSGTSSDFLHAMVPLAKNGSPNQIFNIINLTCDKNLLRINGALLFDSASSKKENAKRLRKAGITSLLVETLAEDTLEESV